MQCPTCQGAGEINAPIWVDLTRNTLHLPDREVQVTRPRVAELLSILVSHWGSCCTLDTLCSELYGWNELDDPLQALRVHVHKSREVLRELDVGLTIVNHWRRGYSLEKTGA